MQFKFLGLLSSTYCRLALAQADFPLEISQLKKGIQLYNVEKRKKL